jgi:hypothetical protein
MIKNTKIFKNILFIICLISIAVGWRIINSNYNIAPNLEFVTVVTVIAAVTMGWRAALIVPVSSMVISDLIIGNSSIFVFTWGSFALIGAGAVILKQLNNKPKTQILSSFGFAASSSFLFFVVTNFGVWLQGWYPATLSGLTSSYVMAIPFYRTMLIGNLILVPSAITTWQLVKAHQATKNLVINPLIRE